LVARGHEVRFYTGARFRERIEATGARWEPMREAPDLDDRDLNATLPAREKLTGLAGLRHDIKHVFIDPVPGQMADLRAILREFPADVILADTGFAGANMLHLRGEAPPVAIFSSGNFSLKSRDTAPFGLGILPSTTPLGRARNLMLDWVLNRILFRDVNAYANAMRRSVGVPTTRQGIFETSSSPFLFLCPVVPGFEYPRGDLPPQVHFIGPFLPDPTTGFTPPAWWDDLTAGRPVVHVTQGTVATDPSALLAPTIRGLADQDVLVVATTGGLPIESLGLGELPANVRLERFIPHDQLLPHVDLMITNGGYNGVQMALARGVPLIAGGVTEDKPEVCNRIAWSGVGLNLKTATPTPEQLRAAVRTVLNDGAYGARARLMAQEIARYDAATTAATLLERLAGTGRPVLRDAIAGAPIGAESRPLVACGNS
jgi:MGT family glycosyltransferase